MSNFNHGFVFITTTCDCTIDNPFINSIGKNILRPKTGGIAMMTLPGLIFLQQPIMNIIKFVQPDVMENTKPWRSGDRAKNYTYRASGDIINNRKFTLLGDPALTLWHFPRLK
jgi:hypothetical protein